MSVFELPQYVYNVKAFEVASNPLEEALALDLLKTENYLASKEEEAKTSLVIKEVTSFTSFDSQINTFLEASLEEAILEALKDVDFKYFKASKVLKFPNKPLAKYLLCNLSEEALEGIYNLASEEKASYLNKNFNNLYAFFIPKYNLKKLNLGYLAYKNDLDLKIKPSKLNYFSKDRFNNKSKGLALTSLLFDDITNILIIDEEDLEALTSKASIYKEASKYLEASKEKAKVKAFSSKFKAISSKLASSEASSSFDNKTIKEALTSEEASLYYTILKRRSIFSDEEKAFIKAKSYNRSFNKEVKALEEALASNNYYEANNIIEEATFYNIKLLIEVLEEKALASEEASKEEAKFLEEALAKASYLEEVLEEEKNTSEEVASSIFEYLDLNKVTSFKYDSDFKFKNIASEVYSVTKEEAKALEKVEDIIQKGTLKTNEVEALKRKVKEAKIKASLEKANFLEAKASLEKAKASSDKAKIKEASSKFRKAKASYNNLKIEANILAIRLEEAKASLDSLIIKFYQLKRSYNKYTKFSTIKDRKKPIKNKEEALEEEAFSLNRFDYVFSFKNNHYSKNKSFFLIIGKATNNKLINPYGKDKLIYGNTIIRKVILK